MQVNSVSSVNSFGQGFNPAQLIGAMSDDDLKTIAYAKASKDVNDKKHRRITNLLYYSVPLAAGVAAAVKPSNMSRIGRLGLGLKGAAALAIPFAIVDATFAAKNKLDKNSRTSAEFTKNHPIVSALATLGAGIAGIFAFNKGAAKLGAKYGEKIAERAYPTIVNVSKKLDSSKILDFASKQLAKVPSSIKEFSKAALDWAPWMLIFANIGHSINHDKVKNAEYMKNYQNLKAVQDVINAQA